MIYSYELEKQLLAGLIKDPESLTEISNFISTSDFYSDQSSLNSTIFRIIEQAINAGDEIDEIIVAQIAGLIARRIVCECNKLETVKQGEKIGIIRFGSRVDIYFNNYKNLAKQNQTTVAGETLIAKK